jgi:hypothetical protein
MEEDKTVLNPSLIGNPVVGTLSGQGMPIKQAPSTTNILQAKDEVQTIPSDLQPPVNIPTPTTENKPVTDTLTDQQIQKEIEEINKSLDISSDTTMSNATPVSTIMPPKEVKPAKPAADQK